MSRNAFALLALALCTGGVVVTLILADVEPAAAPEEGRTAAQTSETSTGDGASANLRPPLRPTAEPELPRPERTGPVRERVKRVAAGESFSLRDAHWVEVDVRLPAGIPADDEPLVLGISLGDGEELSSSAVEAWMRGVGMTTDFRDPDLRWARRPIPASGELVSVPFPADAVNGALLIQSRYVHGPSAMVSFSEEPGRTVLRGSLGVRVTGRLVVPPGAEGRDTRPESFDARIGGQVLRLGPDLSFEACALPADTEHELRVRRTEFLEYTQRITGAPAEHVRVEALLEQGGVVSGTVRGEDGEPLAGIDVRASSVSGGSVTDERGEYRVLPVPPGEVHMVFRHPDYLEGTSAPFPVFEGSDVRDVDGILRRGAVIAGLVLWPGGEPAYGTVRYTPVGSLWDEAGSVSVTDGRFEISGLEAERYEVQASATPAGLQQALAGDWFAVAADVRSGTRNLVLELFPPTPLRGIVRDDLGLLLESFDVVVTPRGRPAWGSADEAFQEFTTTDGRFAFQGLTPGRWTLRAKADGHLLSEWVELSLPRERDVEIALVRSPIVRGRVLDPSGRGTPGAQVLVRTSRGEAVGHRSFPTVTDGFFELTDVPLDAVLTASMAGFVESEPLWLSLVPGQLVDEVVLRLRSGATIAGEVRDAQGGGESGCNVIVLDETGDRIRAAQADDEGRFEIVGVPPGPVTVLAVNERARSGGGARSVLIDVPEEGTIHVVLAYERLSPVRIFGRVTEGGQPIEATVHVLVADRPLLGGEVRAQAGPDGRYELEVDRPGDYVLFARVGNRRSLHEQEVPAVASLEVDIALDSAVLLGRVVGPEGAPLRGISVQLHLPGRGSWLTALASQDGSITDEEGRFVFEAVPPGTVEVVVSVPAGRAAALAPVVLPGLHVVAGEQLELDDIVLEHPGRVTGVVRDVEGRAVPGVEVIVHGDGDSASFSASETTDAQGQFELAAVAPGDRTISARNERLASVESVVAHVRAGGATEVELTVDRGGMLVVRVEGSGSSTEVVVRDASGRRRDGFTPEADLRRLAMAGLSSDTRRIGPLARGRYEVTALAPGGRRVSGQVTVGDEPEVELVLTLERDR